MALTLVQPQALPPFFLVLWAPGLWRLVVHWVQSQGPVRKKCPIRVEILGPRVLWLYSCGSIVALILSPGSTIVSETKHTFLVVRAGASVSGMPAELLWKGLQRVTYYMSRLLGFA